MCVSSCFFSITGIINCRNAVKTTWSHKIRQLSTLNEVIMKRLYHSVLWLILIFVVFVNCSKITKAESIAKIDLRIFYVSNPDSIRAKDFVSFLSENFSVVKTGDLKIYKETDSKDFDVTIFDYDGDGFKAPRPQISRGFSQPVVTVGVVGAFICDRLSLKTGYL